MDDDEEPRGDAARAGAAAAVAAATAVASAAAGLPALTVAHYAVLAGIGALALATVAPRCWQALRRALRSCAPARRSR